MIQNFMSDSLGVMPDRGLVRFVSVGEEYLATNGTTVLGEIETLSRQMCEEGSGIETKRSNTIKRVVSRKASKPEKLNLIPSNRERSRPATSDGKLPTPPLQSPPIPKIPTDLSPLDKKAVKVQKMGRRRSILAMFGKQ